MENQENKENKKALCAGLFVEPNITYRDRAKLLLDKAIQSKHGRRGEGYRDNKQFIFEEGIESLIGAGADIITLNERDSEKSYYHEVEYKDHTFCSVTEKPIVYFISAHLK